MIIIMWKIVLKMGQNRLGKSVRENIHNYIKGREG
jgi:hypothetical protein